MKWVMEEHMQLTVLMAPVIVVVGNGVNFRQRFQLMQGGALQINNPALKHVNSFNIQHWSPLNFFDKLFPWTFMTNHVIPATNAVLLLMGSKKAINLKGFGF